jgi:membrane-bound lytic murein transglycosylase D
LLFISISFYAQAYKDLPDTISIGNVKVIIHPSAKPIFDKEFNMLGANKRYSTALLAKMRLYFPLIEPILKEGNIPDEFKYLCVQESTLNPNAVSTSSAVGYWQFKLETAIDVGMKVDKQIDERRHIIESTKGAVNYFTRNNGVLDNWLSTLLSYRMGLGTLKKTNYAQDWKGKTEIEVDSSTDWYLIRFLAYKHFWEDKLQNEPNLELDNIMVTLQTEGGRNLYDLSDSLQLSYDDLKKHNAWILKDWIPKDKIYTIYHPSKIKTFVSSPNKPFVEPLETQILTASVDSSKLYQPNPKKKSKNASIMSDQVETRLHTVVSGETLSSIASQFEMKLPELLKLNGFDMKTMLMLGQKIKVKRVVPMLEVISQQLDKKAKNAPKKENNSVILEKPKEEEPTRTIHTSEKANGFIIAPADSREISIKSETEVTKVDNKNKVIEKAETDLHVETSNASEIKHTIHIVQAGETLFRISKTYSVSTEDLIKWNNLGKNPSLKIGQKIKLIP